MWIAYLNAYFLDYQLYLHLVWKGQLVIPYIDIFC